MTRIRLVFALLAVLVFTPIGLLVANAFASMEAERAERHNVVAERVFDEMELELSRLVSREEERPFAHYRFYYVPESVSQDRYALARSPLSVLAEQDFVVGYFQIDPDGTLRSPLIPRESSLSRALADFVYDQDVDRAVKGVEMVSGQLPPFTGGLVHEASRARFEQSPGSTTTLQQPLGPNGGGAAGNALAGAGDGAELDAYRALRSLNRGDRDQRRRIRVQVRNGDGGRGLRLQASVRELAPGATHPGAPVLQNMTRAGEIFAHRDAVIGNYLDADAALREEPVVAVPVAVFPMVGKIVGGEHLILFREAFLGTGVYRQGLVLDFTKLVRWLDRSVLGTSDLAAYAVRDFFLRLARPPERSLPDAFVYLHRFSEPFDELAVRMSLRPLPELGGAGYVYAIAALLVLAGALGLVALYRMVGVTIRYAERRSNFAAAVSHELKTPLTAIRMHAEMLRDGMVPDAERQREYYGTITAESERLTRLINNVLEFSRLEQGTREMNLAAGALGPVVADAARTLEPHCKAAGFRLEVHVEEGLPPVRFERDAVIQVVFNLVDNATKYGRGEGEPVIALSCARQDDAVALRVRDSGPGVPAVHLSRVFEAFYRGESELTRTAKGTGIGLALVKGLADRMGAGVTARNAPGGGFEVVLAFRAVGAG